MFLQTKRHLFRQKSTLWCKKAFFLKQKGTFQTKGALFNFIKTHLKRTKTPTFFPLRLKWMLNRLFKWMLSFKKLLLSSKGHFFLKQKGTFQTKVALFNFIKTHFKREKTPLLSLFVLNEC